MAALGRTATRRRRFERGLLAAARGGGGAVGAAGADSAWCRRYRCWRHFGGLPRQRRESAWSPVRAGYDSAQTAGLVSPMLHIVVTPKWPGVGLAAGIAGGRAGLVVPESLLQQRRQCAGWPADVGH
ncbi:hypothetical protein ACTMU2_37065 [Cupriavidus basilensis]